MTILQAIPAVPARTAWTGTVGRVLLRWLEHRQQRRVLAQLRAVHPRILRDIGIDRSELASVVYGDPACMPGPVQAVTAFCHHDAALAGA